MEEKQAQLDGLMRMKEFSAEFLLLLETLSAKLETLNQSSTVIDKSIGNWQDVFDILETPEDSPLIKILNKDLT